LTPGSMQMPTAACSSTDAAPFRPFANENLTCAVRLSRLQQTARDNVKTHSSVFNHMKDQDLVGAVSNKVCGRYIF
jgi:hypothetical protein